MGRLHVDDVDHEGQAELVGGLPGEPQGGLWVVADHLVTEADLHADDDLRVLAGRGDRLVGRGPAHVLELAEKVGDHALHGDVEKGEDAGLGPGR